MTDYTALARAIQSLDFDTVFRIVDGEVVETSDDYAPDVYHDPDGDVTIESLDQWQCFTGMTGQYGYSGAIMHPSEFIGEGIAQRLDEYATDDDRTVFAPVVVYDTDGTDAIGWAIAYREPTTEATT